MKIFMIFQVALIFVTSGFATSAFGQSSGMFTDLRDSKDYMWIKIGNQVWMEENLNFATANGSWCYDDKESNCNIFGRLYDWETAKNACPDGWHLPSDEEWKVMERQLGMTNSKSNVIGYRGNKVGGKLKETGVEYWEPPNRGSTNESGFSALPGGYRFGDSYYYHKGSFAYFWTSTGWTRTLSYNLSLVNRYINITSYGLSIRCIKD